MKINPKYTDWSQQRSKINAAYNVANKEWGTARRKYGHDSPEERAMRKTVSDLWGRLQDHDKKKPDRTID